MQLQQLRERWLERRELNRNSPASRRVRAGALIALTWGVVFAPITGVAAGSAIVLAGPGLWQRLIEGIGAPGLIGLILFFGFGLGFMSGVFFSLVLGIAERGRGVATISLWRATLWGAVAGPLFVTVGLARGLFDQRPHHVPLIVWAVLAAVLSVSGAVLGTLTLAAAKRAR